MPKFVNRINPGKDRMLMKNNQSSWANARDSASGATASDTGDPIIVRVAKSGTKYSLTRMFIAFDTSDIKEVPTHAVLDLSIAALVNGGTGFRVVKVQAGATGDSDTAFASGDYDALQGFSSGATMDGNVVIYSSDGGAGSLTASEHYKVSLNATARRDMANLDEFKLAIVGTKDYTNTAPTADNRTSIDSVDDSTAANRPLLKWVKARGSRIARKSKGTRGRGFARKNINISTGGRTVANGFDEF